MIEDRFLLLHFMGNIGKLITCRGVGNGKSFINDLHFERAR